jgi:hypothetical protein
MSSIWKSKALSSSALAEDASSELEHEDRVTSESFNLQAEVFIVQTYILLIFWTLLR